MAYTNTGCGLAAMLTLLGACGEASNDPDDVTLDPGVNFASLTAEADRLDTRAQSLPTVQAGNIPDMGVVTYNGIVSLNPDEGPDLIGNLRLEADFVGSGIGGGVDNIINDDDQAYTGSLGITGDIVRTGDTNINATLSGTINNTSGELTTLLSTMTGAFQGLGTDMASGTVSGVISGGDYGDTGTGVDGTFAAER